MKIYDCIMYNGEDLLLDLRLNLNYEKVDWFVIIESKFRHNGDIKKKKFNHETFSKFKKKIRYFFIEDLPGNIQQISSVQDENSKKNIIIDNAQKRENYQRNMIVKGLFDSENEDLILVSDADEIPDLRSLDIKKTKDEILIFKQMMFYYKLNLKYENFIWFGTKACKKKKLVSPQWLRNIKNKKYNIFRFDIIFSNTKFNKIRFINDGGWHFTNIMSPKELYHKLNSFLHHVDFEESNLTEKDLENRIKNNLVFYNHNANSKSNDKWNFSKKLKKIHVSELPVYLRNNLEKYKDWIE